MARKAAISQQNAVPITFARLRECEKNTREVGPLRTYNERRGRSDSDGRNVRTRQAATRVLAGSVPPSSEELWEWARKNKYQTDLLKRVESDDGSISEQGVDEILHLKIANVLIDHPSTDTHVVVTGDGSVSEFGTGFIPQIERAIKLGWRVEVWSWSKTLSRKYLTLSKKWPQQVKLIALDPFYESVTFVRPGHYYRIPRDPDVRQWRRPPSRAIAANAQPRPIPE